MKVLLSPRSKHLLMHKYALSMFCAHVRERLCDFFPMAFCTLWRVSLNLRGLVNNVFKN